MSMRTFKYEILEYESPQSRDPGKVVKVHTRDAYPVGALVVHRRLPKDRGRWGVTHAPSGIAIAYAADHKSAMATARTLDASIDWGFSDAECRAMRLRMMEDKAYNKRVKDLCLTALRGSAKLF